MSDNSATSNQDSNSQNANENESDQVRTPGANIKQEVMDEDSYSESEEPYTDLGDFLECDVKDEGIQPPDYDREQELLNAAREEIQHLDNELLKRKLLRSKKPPRKPRKDTRKRRVRPPKPKTHQCDFCDKAFANVFHLRDHISSHTQERVECKICRVVLRTTSMRAHMYRHNNDKSHQCEHCLEKFVRKYSLKEHVLNVHTSESVACPVCLKTLRRSSFHKHMSLHTDETRHRCEACGAAFNTIPKLKNHLVTHTDQRPFTCDDCGAGFKNKESLKAHFRVHSGEAKVKRHACDTCPRKYADPSHLALHKKRHAGVKSHACHMCNRKFLLKSSLRSHLRIHAVPKPFRCQECGRGFDHVNFLDQHVRTIHLGEGAVACDVCDKTFTQPASLAKHRKKFHDAEGHQHRCEQCDKTFRSALSREAHMQGHTGERGFACGTCGKKFRHKTGLLRHVKSHAELQYECRACGWHFADPKRFASHVALHSQARPFECTHPGCPKKFPRQSALNRHLRSAHRFWCEACERTFADPLRYDRHVAMHRPTRGHVCKECGRKFVARSSLSAHARRPHRAPKRRWWCRTCLRSFHGRKAYASHAVVHSDEKRACPVCARAFRSEGGLTAHQDKDHAVRVERHWCDLCDVGFHERKDLENHAEFHAGLRVLACAVCYKAYTHKATLNRHLKTHGPMAQAAFFTCKVCGKAFHDSRPYGNHLKLHSGEHPYVCQTCEKTFRDEASLALHRKKAHKVDV